MGFTDGDLSEQLPTVIFFVFWGILGVVNIVTPPEYKPIAFALGYVGLVATIFGIEATVRIQLSRFRHINTVIRYPGSKIRKSLFIEDFIEHQLTDDINGPYVTQLNLGKKFEFQDYSKVDKVFIRHDKPFQERVKYGSGKCAYAGTVVPHSSTDYCEMHLYPKPFVDHGQSYPQFILVVGGGDYSGDTLVSQFAVRTTSGDGQQLEASELLTGEQMEGETLPKLRELVTFLKGENSTLRQRIIRLEEERLSLKDEVSGLLKSKTDVNKLAKEMLLSIAEAQNGIRNAVKSMKGTGEFNYYIIGMGIFVLATLYLLSQNPQMSTGIMTWFRTNRMFIGLGVVAVIIGGYYYLKQKRLGL